MHVWVDETRPRNQGASLTAFELGAHGVPHTLIADNAGGHLMQKKLVDLCIVGTDRTTSTGDVANKIGTYLKALAARDNYVPFLRGAALLDHRLEPDRRQHHSHRGARRRGSDAYDRHACRTAAWPRSRSRLKGRKAANYGFDVTPARLITGFITERGVTPATRDGLATLYPGAPQGRRGLTRRRSKPFGGGT